MTAFDHTILQVEVLPELIHGAFANLRLLLLFRTLSVGTRYPSLQLTPVLPVPLNHLG